MPNMDLQCPFCPKTSSRGTGLASHIRGAHPREYSSWIKNRKGVQAPKTLKASRPAASAPVSSGGGLDHIIALLEKQRAVIEGALAALHQLGGFAATAAPAAVAESSPKAKKKGMSPEGKARLIAALKRRWAAKKASSKR
jgi:hypothetical protein